MSEENPKRLDVWSLKGTQYEIFRLCFFSTQNITELTNQLPIEEPTVSKHVKKLEKNHILIKQISFEHEKRVGVNFDFLVKELFRYSDERVELADDERAVLRQMIDSDLFKKYVSSVDELINPLMKSIQIVLLSFSLTYELYNYFDEPKWGKGTDNLLSLKNGKKKPPFSSFFDEFNEITELVKNTLDTNIAEKISRIDPVTYHRIRLGIFGVFFWGFFNAQSKNKKIKGNQLIE